MSESTHSFPVMTSSREDAHLFPEISSPIEETSSPMDESAHLFKGMNGKLYKAAKDGNVSALNDLINGKLNIFQEFTRLRNSVLHIAISGGNLRFIKKLLEKGRQDLDPRPEFLRAKNSDGNTALHLAAFHGHHELVQKLIGLMEGDVEAGNFLRIQNSEGNTALHEAAKGGNYKVVKELLQHGRGDNLISVSNAAGERTLEHDRHDDLTSVSNAAGETALFIASKGGHTDIVERLLDSMARNSNMKRHDGQTPLHCAVFYGHAGIVEKLLLHSPGLAKQTDGRGRTALHMLSLSREYREERLQQRLGRAIRMDEFRRQLRKKSLKKSRHGYESTETPLLMITRLLLEEDNSLCYKQDVKKQTPLHIAVEAGKYELVGILINYGGDCIDLVDNDGRTPLHLAVINAGRITNTFIFFELRRFRIMLSSLISKFSVNHQDNRGQTPVQIAMENIKSDAGLYESIMEVLQANGALLTPEILEHTRGMELSPAKSFNAANVSINAVLIATVSFAAAFTLPGGLDSQSGEKPKAVFINVLLFKLFLICDTFSFCTSIASAILVQYTVSAKRQDEFLVQSSVHLLWSALISLLVAFGAAVHLVIAPSPWLVGTVWSMLYLVPYAIAMVLSGAHTLHGERYMHWRSLPTVLLMPLICTAMVFLMICRIFFLGDIFYDVTRWIRKLLKWCGAQIPKVHDRCNVNA